MLIISPKWIYLNNKRLDGKKALLIDGSIIKEIIDKGDIKKKYKELKAIDYSDHILMPSLSEGCINVDDCRNIDDIELKLSKLLKNGVTKVNLSTVNDSIMKYNFGSHLELGQMIEIDGNLVNQQTIKNITSLFDNFKSDPTKLLSIKLKNIRDFDNDIIKKISFITNEVNTNLHINLKGLRDITNKEEIKNYIMFWEEINLMNNCYFYNFPMHNEQWLRCAKENDITLMISYKEINNYDNMRGFLSLLEKKYKCVLITDESESYRLYQIINLLKFSIDDRVDLNIINKLIDSVTSNVSGLFNNYLSSGCIKKGNQASFNLFNYKATHFVEDDQIIPNLYNLDKESLTHVWSSGKQLNLR